MAIADAPRAALGLMADGLYGSAYSDAMESVPALAYPENIATYGKMRFDPQISATLKAYTHPLRAASWCVNPKGCRDEVVQLVADAWGLPILGGDDGPGPFRRRGVLWYEHLRLALLMLVYGHAPFAIAGEVTGDPMRWRLTELSERLPSTIAHIEVDEATGKLLWIKQNIGGPNPPKIRASNLLWYVHEREGANLTGRSMLREAYGPWLLKHEMWRVLATSSRRFGMGVPVVNAPPGATQAEIDEAARTAARMRVGDQSGQGLPHGYTASLMGMTGSTPDTLAFVRYLDAQIAQAVLVSVLNLDSSPNGSRALGETMVALLHEAWRSTAEEIAVPASQLSTRIVDWNFSEDEPVPAILCTDLGQTEVTAEAIAALTTCGALVPDDGMDATLRQRYGLPERLDTTPAPALANTGPDPDTVPADTPRGGTGKPAPDAAPATRQPAAR